MFDTPGDPAVPIKYVQFVKTCHLVNLATCLYFLDTEGDVHQSKKIGSSNGCKIKDGESTL